MKNILLGCALMLVSFVCSAQPKADPQQARAIGHLFGERYAHRWIASTMRIENGLVKDWTFDHRRYNEAIRKMDTTGLPDRVKIAWLEYVNAVQRWSDSKPVLLRTDNFTDLAPKKPTLPPEITMLIYKAEPTELREAWSNLEKSAASYVGTEIYYPHM